MKLYRPADVLTFGIYNGEDMRFVYTFDPEYVEFMINTLDHFVIDVKDYKDLHTCQIEKASDPNRWLGTVNANGETYSLRNFLKEFTDVLELNYYKTPEKINRFKFSDKTISVLQDKMGRLNHYL